MREGLTVGRSLYAAAIVRLGWAGINGRADRRRRLAWEGHTMKEGLTVGRSLPAAAIVHLGGAGVNGTGAATYLGAAAVQRRLLSAVHPHRLCRGEHVSFHDTEQLLLAGAGV